MSGLAAHNALMIDSKRIGDRLRVLRERAGISRAEMLLLTCRDRNYVAAVERGETTRRFDLVADHCTLIGVAFTDIFFDGDSPLTNAEACDPVRIGSFLKEHRLARGIRLADMSAALYGRQSKPREAFVSSVELGRAQQSPDTIARFCNVLGLRVEEVFLATSDEEVCSHAAE
jgi:transcriptional regulator with XRE-family HTH domain